MLRSFFNGLGDLLYPPNCLICKMHISDGLPKGNLCASCLSSIQFNYPPFCLKCSRHLSKAKSAPKCQSCRKTQSHFDFAWGACFYNDPLKGLIHKFKYSQKTGVHKQLSILMMSFIHTYHLDIQQFSIIVPIPLSSTRLRERGFNQSELLAAQIARKTNIDMNSNSLVRIHNTKIQAFLSQKERWTNIQGAFKIKHSAPFKDQSVLIIDDLLTTGATASEAAKMIKLAGAKTVGILTLAIAL